MERSERPYSPKAFCLLFGLQKVGMKGSGKAQSVSPERATAASFGSATRFGFAHLDSAWFDFAHHIAVSRDHYDRFGLSFFVENEHRRRKGSRKEDRTHQQ